MSSNQYLDFKQKSNHYTPASLVDLLGFNKALHRARDMLDNEIPYIEAVELLIGLYKSTGNSGEQKNWETFLESIQENGVHLDPLNQI